MYVSVITSRNLLKLLDGLGGFWSGGFLRPILHTVTRNFGNFLKIMVFLGFSLELCPKVSPQHFDHRIVWSV